MKPRFLLTTILTMILAVAAQAQPQPVPELLREKTPMRASGPAAGPRRRPTLTARCGGTT